jgi:hypothetical protein
LLLSVGGIAAVGGHALAHYGPNVFDHWIYGRYLEVFLPTTLILALRIAGFREAIFSAAATVLFAAWLLWRLPDEAAPAVYINLLAIWADEVIRVVRGTSAQVTFVHWIGWSLLPGLTLITLMVRKAQLIAYALIFANFAAAAYLGANTHGKVAERRVAPKYELMRSAERALKPGSCILLDRAGYFDYMEVYDFYLLRYAVRHMEGEESMAGCPDAILTLRPERYRESHPEVIGRNRFDKLVLVASRDALLPVAQRP